MIERSWAWVDQQLGQVSMYRLLIVGLGVIAAIAVVLSATGTLFFAPLDLLISLLVALAASALSSWLCGWLFHTRAHVDSAVITGLILFFLFWPSHELRDLGVLALAAVIANLSKYIIAWRGRHVVNPAAVGALVVGLTGLSSTTWWVGQGALLIPVLVLAVLVVIRTRTLTLVGIFVMVAVLTIGLRLSGEGQPFGAALWTAVTSYPVLFLAAVMLTEPLTLPPRRWQRLVEAILVAVLLAVPFSIGRLVNTPELALIIGNLWAFIWGQRGSICLTLADSRWIGPRTRELWFRADHPVRFRAGQYLELDVPHRRPDSRGRRRVFSISSAPRAGELTIALTIASRSSSFKRALIELPAGARIRATGVGGDFLLPVDDRPVLLIAGGIGVTPFASQIADRPTSDAVLVHVVSDHADLAYAEVFQAAGTRVLVASPTPQAALPEGYLHLGARQLTAEALADSVPDADQRVAYLSGPPAMVQHIRAVLRAAGVRRVHTDTFSGY